MNYQIIFKMLSIILWIMAASFGLCLGVSIFYNGYVSEAEALPYWITSCAIAMFFALTFYYPSRNAETKLYKKEALCVTGLGWLICAVLGAVPYMLIIDSSFYDAFFESSSGFTTTGASVFGHVEGFPRSLLFWRSLTQWIGGLGVVVFFVAILSSLGAGGRVLYSNEMGLDSSELESGKIQSGVWKIVYVYVFISIACTLSFWAFGMGWFDAVCHMMPTVSTGGFSTYDNSFMHFKSPSLEWVCIFFMIVGSINFAILIMLFKGRVRTFLRNTELWWFLGILLFSTIAIAAVLIAQDSITFRHLHDAFRESAFQTVSLMSTTGFVSADYQLWPPLAHVMIFLIMIAGGCSGSTSGGLKVVRVVKSIKMSILNVEKSFRPHVVRTIRMNGHPIDESDADATYSFIILYIVTGVVGVLGVSLMEVDISFAGCLSSVVATLSNAGPGLAEVGPTANFGFMTGGSKILLSFVMIMGRLEFYAIFALFMPSLWKKFQ